MTNLNQKSRPQKAISVIVLCLMLSASAFLTGCGDSQIADTPVSPVNSGISAGNIDVKDYDSTTIHLDISIKFKSESISDSRILESNIGNVFNQITSFSKELKPGEVFDLEDLPTYGIFGLYISSTGIFTLYNSDGMSFSSKSVLMEKCSFIDLKLRNDDQKVIKVTGLVAGE